MKVLVTGSSGFIGQSIVRLLTRKGVDNITHCRSAESAMPNQFVWDLESEELACDKLLGVTDIVHCAGLAHDIKGAVDWNRYLRINCLASVALLAAASEAGVKTFTYVSTVKAAGVDRGEQVSPYTYSKIEAERMLFLLGKLLGLKVNVVRPALVYGPGMKGNLLALNALASRLPFLSLSNIRNKKSLIHKDDLCEIIYATMCSGFDQKTIIAAEDTTYSTGEIFDAMRTNHRKKSCLELSLPLWILRRSSRGRKLMADTQVSPNVRKMLKYATKRKFDEYCDGDF